MASALCQKWSLKTWFFVKKLKILCSLDHTIFVQISPACGPNTYQIIYGEIFDFHAMLALATVAGKSFNGKFTATIDFPLGYFTLPLLMLTLVVGSLSIQYLFGI